MSDKAKALDPQRLAFEDWADERWGREAYRHKSDTSGEWEAWKAARTQAPAAPAVAAPEATKPERAPFTQAQLRRLYDNSPEIGNDVRSRYAFYRVAMLVEAAHGITAPTTQEPQQ